MNFQITDGLNKVSICISDICNYFYFKKPLSIVWADDGGSLEKYFCVAPFDKEIINDIKTYIHENLNNDYTDRLTELMSFLAPLFKTFKNGEYRLNYYHSSTGKYFEYTTSADDYSKIHHFEWYLMFSKPLTLMDQENRIADYELFINNRKEEHLSVPSLLDYTTTKCYDAYDKSFMATQPESVIDQERVKYFETQILKGERPFAIILNSFHEQRTKIGSSFVDAVLQSDNYVLDGHHKLLAYKNLNINPSIAEITYLPKTREEAIPNIDQLTEVLYPWQAAYIIETWPEYILDFKQSGK